MEQDGHNNQEPGQKQPSKEPSEMSSETSDTDSTCKTASQHIVMGIRHAIESFLNDYKTSKYNLKIILTIGMLFVAVAKNVSGAVGFGSDCPIEWQVALYLFVKSFFAFLFWIGILAIGISGKFIGTIWLNVIIVLLKMFSLAWLIVGSLWVSKYSAILKECPLYVNDWEPHFIRFAIAWICLDWLLFLIYLFTGVGSACHGNGKIGQSPSDRIQVSGRKQQTDRPSKSPETPKITFTTASELIVMGIRYTIESFLDDYNKYKIILTIGMLIIAVAKNVAGAVGLGSDCPMEWQVALYLFVKSFFAFLFWIGILAIGLRGRFSGIKQVLLDVIIVILKMFSLAWLIVGSLWVSKYSVILKECPLYVNDWEPHFIQFAIAWICLDWLLILIYLFSGLVFACLEIYAKSKQN